MYDDTEHNERTGIGMARKFEHLFNPSRWSAKKPHILGGVVFSVTLLLEHGRYHTNVEGRRSARKQTLPPTSANKMLRE